MNRPPDHSSRLARGEMADPAEAERFAAEHPDEYMRRRDFLARTAALAGAAGLATVLPSDVLVAEAARHHRHRLPSPRHMPIDTVVVLMMENRSFDHYFGWYPDADGKNRGLSYRDAEGDRVRTHHLGGEYQGCGFRDPDHSWDGGRFQYHHGKMSGFVKGNREGTGSDAFAAGFYLEKDLPFIPHAARAYTLYDRWFCSIMDSTYPNRHYQWGAQDGGTQGNQLPPQTSQRSGYTWETIFDRATKHGLSAKYYASDLPFAALYGQRGVSWTHPVRQFYEDAAAGRLPNIAFVDPAFVGEDQGTSGDEHPHGDVRVGQAFMSDVVHAFIESPQYRRGVLFIDYDEWGGFFEHVRPRLVPDDRQDHKHLHNDWGFTGFRIPGVAISPFSRKGGVSHMEVTHESILKLISYRFRLGTLNKRHRYASNIARSLDFAHPHYGKPDLPDPRAVAATPCSPLGGQQAERPKPHDMAKLESSGLLERLGYEVERPTFDRLFRQPDTIRKALRDSGSDGR
jgi:phospholipase C